jgi:hypothetical protein
MLLSACHQPVRNFQRRAGFRDCSARPPERRDGRSDPGRPARRPWSDLFHLLPLRNVAGHGSRSTIRCALPCTRKTASITVLRIMSVAPYNIHSHPYRAMVGVIRMATLNPYPFPWSLRGQSVNAAHIESGGFSLIADRPDQQASSVQNDSMGSRSVRRTDPSSSSPRLLLTPCRRAATKRCGNVF